MTIKLFWRCESTTFDGTHDYSAGDSTPTALGSPSISAAAGKVGTNGISCVASVGSHYALDAASIVGPVGSAGYWYKAVTANPATANIIGLDITGTGNDILAVYSNGTDEVQFRNGLDGSTTHNITTSGANLAPDTWYGIIIRWDFSNPASASKKLEVYNSAGTLLSGMPAEITATDLSTSVPSAYTTIRCGRHSAGSAVVQYADHFVIADTYEGVTAAMLATASYSSLVAPDITDVDTDEDVTHGEALTITGTGLGAAQATYNSVVKIISGTVEVTQTCSGWSDTGFTIAAADTTGLPFGAITGLRITNDNGTDTLALTHSVPSGYAYGTANVPWPDGAYSVFEDAAPAVADGDQYEYETTTSLDASVQVFEDGTFLINADSGVHAFSVRVFDQTDETWSDWVEFTASGTYAPADEEYSTIYGRAVTSTGVLQTIALADDVLVPTESVFKNGIALSSSGYAYVCPWPATMAVGYVGGVAVRYDGALIVAEQASITTKYYANGIPVSYRGEVSVSLSAPTSIQGGIGRVGDALCVSDL